MGRSPSRLGSRFSALCGILAPLLMVTLWSVASVLRQGYNQLTQKGSELGTGSNAIVMNLNFAITGALILIFAFGLSKNMSGGRMLKIGIILVLVSGIMEALTGAFPCDPGCPPQTGSFSQNAHLGIAVVFFGSIAFSPLLIGLGLDGDGFWRPYREYSIVSGLAGVGFGFGFSVAVLTSIPYVGLLERVFLAFPFLWFGIMANYMLHSPIR